MVRKDGTHGFLLLLLVAFIFTPVSISAGDTDLPTIMNTLERFFMALDGGDSRALWTSLAFKSKDAVVADVVSRLQPEKRGSEAAGRIRADFDRNGEAAVAYWKSLRSRVDSGAVLSDSRWEPGEIDGVRASILITRNGSDRAAIVGLSKEEGSWRVDLSDTFFREPTGTAIIP